jgi:methylamine dehydrogenase heavy chain
MNRILMLAGCAVLSGVAHADIPETMGTATLSAPGPHWVWVDDLAFANLIDGRAYLVDADAGTMLGMISTGALFLNLELPHDYSRIYSAETYYSRGTRGTRTDVVSIYDTKTLEPVGEIVIPPKRQAGLPMPFYTGLTDDQSFMLVYNFTPAQSVTVIDLAAGKVTGEVATPGCALVYPSGPRRFFMLCADGALLDIELAQDGSEAQRVKSDAFFDPRQDPITEKGVRLGSRWLFLSFNGLVHEADFAVAQPQYAKTWSIVTESERKAGWRTGGAMHVALHAPTGRLYALMHKGPVESRKEPGTDVWIFDVARHERVQQLRLTAPAASIAVTPDAKPLFLTTAGDGKLEVYDAASGKHLRTVTGLGQTPFLIQTLPVGAP